MLITVVAIAAVVWAGAATLMWWRAAARAAQQEERLERASGDLEQLQRAFQRFVPPAVVESIIHRGVQTHGERREVTVLFADLIGFTTLSESREPEVVVRILNGYFEEMTRAIAEHSGFVSKFMGDGLLALFGAPDHNPWQSMDAVYAALAMRQALARYNERIAADGFGPLRMGVGIHRGPVVAGVLGSSEFVEYTVIGDAVNTASRVEGLTRRFDVEILISEEVRATLDDRFRVRAMEPSEVRGKAGPLATFAVEGATR